MKPPAPPRPPDVDLLEAGSRGCAILLLAAIVWFVLLAGVGIIAGVLVERF